MGSTLQPGLRRSANVEVSRDGDVATTGKHLAFKAAKAGLA